MRIVLYFLILNVAANLCAMQIADYSGALPQKDLEKLLSLAGKKNRSEEIKELIETGKINMPRNNEVTIASLLNVVVVKSGYYSAVTNRQYLEHLLSRHPTLRVSDDGWYPLHWAIHTENPVLVKLMMHAGADIHQKNARGYTPLMEVFNRPDIAQLLIDAGADVDYQAPDGQTALLRVTNSARLEVMRVLVDAGAQYEIRNKDRKTAYDIANASHHHLAVRNSVLKCKQFLERAFSKHKLP
jgi:ankyrin repeat protein